MDRTPQFKTQQDHERKKKKKKELQWLTKKSSSPFFTGMSPSHQFTVTDMIPFHLGSKKVIPDLPMSI